MCLLVGHKYLPQKPSCEDGYALVELHSPVKTNVPSTVAVVHVCIPVPQIQCTQAPWWTVYPYPRELGLSPALVLAYVLGWLDEELK
jgi:hypothetical protein